MRRRQPLGLDELMIVNPGRPRTRAVLRAASGLRYRAQTLRRPREYLFLGADGMLYQVRGGSRRDLLVSPAAEPNRFFLGMDGALYEVIE